MMTLFGAVIAKNISTVLPAMHTSIANTAAEQEDVQVAVAAIIPIHIIQNHPKPL
jgi:hypothetical protein